MISDGPRLICVRQRLSLSPVWCFQLMAVRVLGSRMAPKNSLFAIALGSRSGWWLVCLLLFAATNHSLAETGHDAWLRYAPITNAEKRDAWKWLPTRVVALDDGPIVEAGKAELARGIRGLLGIELNTAMRTD